SQAVSGSVNPQALGLREKKPADSGGSDAGVLASWPLPPEYRRPVVRVDAVGSAPHNWGSSALVRRGCSPRRPAVAGATPATSRRGSPAAQPPHLPTPPMSCPRPDHSFPRCDRPDFLPRLRGRDERPP